MALTPGVQISKGIQPTDPVPVDSWSGPYDGATEALAKTAANTSIPLAVRFKSMEVRLIINGVAKKYWYRDAVTDNDLVEFSSSGSGGGGVGTDTGVRSLTANWQSTFSTVSSLSAFWSSNIDAGSYSASIAIPDPLKFFFTGNGITTNFTVSGTNTSNNASYIEVYIDNVRQLSNTTYTLSADIVKFIDPPELGSSIVIITPNLKDNINSMLYKTNIPDNVMSVAVGYATPALASFWKNKTIIEVLDAILFPKTLITLPIISNGFWNDNQYWDDDSAWQD
jgi:hypothetical protein